MREEPGRIIAAKIPQPHFLFRRGIIKGFCLRPFGRNGSQCPFFAVEFPAMYNIYKSNPRIASQGDKYGQLSKVSPR